MLVVGGHTPNQLEAVTFLPTTTKQEKAEEEEAEEDELCIDVGVTH